MLSYVKSHLCVCVCVCVVLRIVQCYNICTPNHCLKLIMSAVTIVMKVSLVSYYLYYSVNCIVGLYYCSLSIIVSYNFITQPEQTENICSNYYNGI